MMDDPKLLPKPAKIAATHAYKELGFSDEKIAEMLGIDFKTVMRYKNKELDKEWEEFSSAIKKIYLEQDFELAQLAVKEIKKKIGKARFYELVGLLKTVRELQSPQQTQQQINIAAENMKVEFIENES
jgi:transcriptional regulator with XRE-family HTH domain